jgi:cofilin
MLNLKVTDDSIKEFNEMKLVHKFRYIILNITDDEKEVKLEYSGKKEETYENFKAKLPKSDCRYAVFDFEFKAEDGGDRAKLIFFIW